MKRVAFAVAALLAMGLFLFGCDGKSVSNGGDDDESALLGCVISVEGGPRSSIDDPADCLPDDIPDDVDQFVIEAAKAFLRAYIGRYIDQNGDYVDINCEPDGYWEFPDARSAEICWETGECPICPFEWTIPVSVEPKSESSPRGSGYMYWSYTGEFDLEDPTELPLPAMGFSASEEDIYSGDWDRTPDGRPRCTVYVESEDGGFQPTGDIWTKEE